MGHAAAGKSPALPPLAPGPAEAVLDLMRLPRLVSTFPGDGPALPLLRRGLQFPSRDSAVGLRHSFSDADLGLTMA